MVEASEAVLTAQQRRQVGLRFLLDPGASLVRSSHPPSESPALNLPRAIGLKFRYLRMQAGLSPWRHWHSGWRSWRRRSPTHAGDGYQPYHLAWVPGLSRRSLPFPGPTTRPWRCCCEFVRRLQEPSHPGVTHLPAPGAEPPSATPATRVCLRADLTDRQVVRLRCTSCGRSFTRGYAGEVGDQASPPAAAARGIPLRGQVGGRYRASHARWAYGGLTNRHIARRLGWGEKTVRMYWIALNLEAQVHKAQARRQTETAHERQAALRARVEAILESLCPAYR